MKWEHASQIMHRGLLCSRGALSMGWMCADLSTYTHDVCTHRCHTHKEKKEQHTQNSVLTSLDAGISDDAVLSVVLPGIYQAVYKSHALAS